MVVVQHGNLNWWFSSISYRYSYPIRWRVKIGDDIDVIFWGHWAISIILSLGLLRSHLSACLTILRGHQFTDNLPTISEACLCSCAELQLSLYIRTRLNSTFWLWELGWNELQSSRKWWAFGLECIAISRILRNGQIIRFNKITNSLM